MVSDGADVDPRAHDLLLAFVESALEYFVAIRLNSVEVDVRTTLDDLIKKGDALFDYHEQVQEGENVHPNKNTRH